MNINSHFYLNTDKGKRQYFTTTDRQEPWIQYTNIITSSSFIQCLTFSHRDLNGYSPPSHMTFFSLDI